MNKCIKIDMKRVLASSLPGKNVLYSDNHNQYTLITIYPNYSLGWTKNKRAESIRVESGEARISIENRDYNLNTMDVFIIPKKKLYNIYNTSVKTILKISINGSPRSFG